MDTLADEGVIALGGPLGGDKEKFLIIFDVNSLRRVEERLAAILGRRWRCCRLQKSSLGRFCRKAPQSDLN